MLSVLIPTYNYSVVSLVKTLYSQLQDKDFSFEIICLDNGSKSKTDLLNEEINSIPFCNFNCLEKDVGRSKIRNLLAERSKYEWLLFLDSDVLPSSDRFIANYLEATYNNQVVYGGLKYDDNKPQKELKLRWVYGKKREEVLYEKRKLDPNKHFSSANFLINKKVFNRVRFDESLTEYGHEDTLLAIELVNRNNLIHQIDNAVYHLGLDENLVFIQKTRKAVENLYLLENKNKIKPENSKLLKSYSNIKKLKMKKILAILFNEYSYLMERNLISENPSLKVYDLYKLSYLCSISKKQ